MKVYTITGFAGHYPVGTAAVVRAANRREAVAALEAELTARGLRQTISEDALRELVMRAGPEVRILCDGNY